MADEVATCSSSRLRFVAITACLLRPQDVGFLVNNKYLSFYRQQKGTIAQLRWQRTAATADQEYYHLSGQQHHTLPPLAAEHAGPGSGHGFAAGTVSLVSRSGWPWGSHD